MLQVILRYVCMWRHSGIWWLLWSFYITAGFVRCRVGKEKATNAAPPSAGKLQLQMTTARQEWKAITNIHQKHSEDEAIHSEGGEEKYHQYLTLFYGEATWFGPRSCAGDQQQSIIIDKICVHGRPSHFVSLCPASVKLPPRRSQSQSLVSAPSSHWLPGVITLSLPAGGQYWSNYVRWQGDPMRTRATAVKQAPPCWAGRYGRLLHI